MTSFLDIYINFSNIYPLSMNDTKVKIMFTSWFGLQAAGAYGIVNDYVSYRVIDRRRRVKAWSINYDNTKSHYTNIFTNFTISKGGNHEYFFI